MRPVFPQDRLVLARRVGLVRGAATAVLAHLKTGATGAEADVHLRRLTDRLVEAAVAAQAAAAGLHRLGPDPLTQSRVRRERGP